MFTYPRRGRVGLAAIGTLTMSLLLTGLALAPAASAASHKDGFKALVPQGTFSVYGVWTDASGTGHNICTPNPGGTHRWVTVAGPRHRSEGTVRIGTTVKAIAFTSPDCTYGYVKEKSGRVPDDGLSYFYLPL